MKTELTPLLIELSRSAMLLTLERDNLPENTKLPVMALESLSNAIAEIEVTIQLISNNPKN